MMTTMLVPDEHWRPAAYVTMQDETARAEIVSVLERCGWTVILQPTGCPLTSVV